MAMHKIFVRILAAFIPVKSWRKAFRDKMRRKDIFGDLRSAFTEIKAKRDTVLRHKDSCEIIVLGSSHVAYGINPAFIGPNCYNLGSNSQDLYTARQLLEYLRPQLPKLKKVILCIDVFSRGWCLDRTSAEHICAAYTYLYGINYQLFNDRHNYLKKCKALDNEPLLTVANINGYLNPPKLNFTDTAESRVKLHLKSHNRECSQYAHIENIVKNKDLCSRLQIILLLPPLRRDYQELLPPNLLANDIRPLIADSTVRVLDFSSDSDFMFDDFYDFDHLNPRGAEKLSKKLKAYINC